MGKPLADYGPVVSCDRMFVFQVESRSLVHIAAAFSRNAFLFQYMNWDSAGAMMAETYIPYIGLLLVMFIETKRARNTAQYE